VTFAFGGGEGRGLGSGSGFGVGCGGRCAQLKTNSTTKINIRRNLFLIFPSFFRGKDSPSRLPLHIPSCGERARSTTFTTSALTARSWVGLEGSLSQMNRKVNGNVQRETLPEASWVNPAKQKPFVFSVLSDIILQGSGIPGIRRAIIQRIARVNLSSCCR